MIRLVALVALFAPASSAPAQKPAPSATRDAAPEVGRHASPPAARTAPRQAPSDAERPAAPRAWTGELLPAPGAEPVRPANVPASLADVAARLADARLTVEGQRDFERARTQLTELWLEVARAEPFPGQAEALTRVVLARAELLARLGDLDAARAALTAPLPVAEVRTARGTWRTEPAGPELLALAADVRADARVVERLAQAAGADQRAETRGPHFADPEIRAYVASRFGLPSRELDQAVAQALPRGDVNLIESLGIRAAPTLAAIVLFDPEGRLTFEEDFQLDPLWMLLQVDRIGAAHLVLDHLDTGGQLWRLRILDVLGNLKGALERPAWDAVLAALFEDEQGRSRVLRELDERFDYANIGEPLVRVLAEQARDPSSTRESGVHHLIATKRTNPSVRAVYAAALEHPDHELRMQAARRLRELEGTARELRQLADGESAEERRVAANSLGFAHRDEEGRALALRLARDPDADVRAAAVTAIGRQRSPFPLETYLEAAVDPAPQVQVALVQSLDLDDPTQEVAVLLRLAGSAHRDVLESVDRRLMTADWDDEQHLLSVLEARFRQGAYAFQHESNVTHKSNLEHFLYDRITPTAAGLRTTARIAVDPGDEAALRAALRRMHSLMTTEKIVAALLELDPGALARFFARTQREVHQGATQLLRGLAASPATPLGPFDALARDNDADRVVRVRAAQIVSAHDGATGLALARELVREPSWKTAAATEAELDALRLLAREQHPGVHPFVLEVLDDPAVDDRVALAVAGAFQSEFPRADEVALRILDRWLGELREADSALRLAVEHLGTMDPDRVDPQVVIRAAHEPHYAQAALKAMGSLRRPEFLPVLGRAVEGTQYLTPTVVSDQQLQFFAVYALTRYRSDEAARLLLEGMPPTQGSHLYEKIRGALTVIREYHEQRDYWGRQRASVADRGEAVGELLGMLSDSSDTVRAEAARGLATLGALEAIPRLIPLLKDESETVRTAARESLDRLHARARAEERTEGTEEPPSNG